MTKTTRCARRSTLCVLVVLVVMLGARSASAAVIYNFRLPVNGAVGPITIELTMADFAPAAGLAVIQLTSPLVTQVTSTPALTLNQSVVGLDIDPAVTLFGVSLLSSGTLVLLNNAYPADFFTFTRTPTQTGTFLSTAGLVQSALSLTTVTPTATLVVTQVPEPATACLFAAAAAMAAVRRLRRRHVS